MSEDNDNLDEDELRPEYEISELKGGVRGKYLQRYREETNLASLRRKFAPPFRPMNR